jgi:hypothetical protein
MHSGLGAVYDVGRPGGKVVGVMIVFEDRRVGKFRGAFKVVTEASTYVTQLGLRKVM